GGEMLAGCSQCCWDAARSREWCLYPELCCPLKQEERLSLGRKPRGLSHSCFVPYAGGC
uniref:Uncharacterized protein n=1 Tax=Meleagris gallopavo TaxID=9103 RepID=A0A803Y839_MELGA